MKFLKLLGKILLFAFAFIGVVIVLVAIFVSPETTQTTSDVEQVEAEGVGKSASSAKQAEAKDAGKIASNAKRINSSDICRGKDAELPFWGKTVSSLGRAALVNACETAARMIADGADIHAHDSSGIKNTPLHYAARENAFETAKLLIAHGADVNARGHDDLTPLHFVGRGGAKTANLLIVSGADINARGKNFGDTPLHKAAQRNAIESTRLLINQGSDVNALGKYGHTPLHMSAAYNATETTELLVASGADVNAIDTLHNRTPLDEALSEQKAERHLKELGAGGDPDKYGKIIALLRSHGGRCNKGCP